MLWNKGPRYLQNPNPSAAKEANPQLDINNLEIKTTSLTVNVMPRDSIDILMESVSGWLKLKIRIASLLIMKHCLLKRIPLKARSSLLDLQNAEITMIKYLQNRYYQDDVSNLSSNRQIAKKITLAKIKSILRPLRNHESNWSN